MEIESIIKFLGNAIKDIRAHQTVDDICKQSGNLKNAIRTIEICMDSLLAESKIAKDKPETYLLAALKCVEYPEANSDVPAYCRVCSRHEGNGHTLDCCVGNAIAMATRNR